MAKYKGYIYLITNSVNGKQYVGKTNSIERRWREHKNHRGGTSILEKAFLKYGILNFKFEIVDSLENSDLSEFNKKLSELEIYYIEKLGTYNTGYNATTGGDGISNMKMSQETKAKISKALTGRKLSEEHKQACGKAFKGHHHTDDARLKIQLALLNRDSSIYKAVGDKLRGKKRDTEMIKKAAFKRRKAVCQYNLHGELLAEYSGAVDTPYNEANIIACCTHKTASAYGYIWRYKSDTSPLSIPINIHKSNIPIIQKDMEDNIITIYNSITEASHSTGISRTGINNALKGRSNSSGGYKWTYKEEGGL